jgi:TonB family protein
MDNANGQSSDRLLWLAAGVIALMGLAWLVVAAPWSTPDMDVFDELPVAAIEPAAAETVIATAAPARTLAAAATERSDPLNMARMAFEAGMLTEPADYSAWTLFGRVASAEPGNTAAREGLEQVATALLQRGNSALEQGRYEDASAIAETITARLPEHPGAIALAAEIARALTPPEPVRPPVVRQPVVVAEVPEPVDPMPEMNAGFLDAMARNELLRPPGTSAVDILNEMLEISAEHELAIAARDMLVTEMLDRSQQSIEALDTRAAQTWIDSAAPLSADPASIDRAQERLTQHLIETETQKILPASELNQTHIESPEFPRIALERGIEGWVDLEFIVTPTGRTDNITVTDASHARYFREEAVAAVEAWRFEPIMFMDRAIPKRSYTRLAFVLD